MNVLHVKENVGWAGFPTYEIRPEQFDEKLGGPPHVLKPTAIPRSIGADRTVSSLLRSFFGSSSSSDEIPTLFSLDRSAQITRRVSFFLLISREQQQ